jgi:serine/threonine protein kinase
MIGTTVSHYRILEKLGEGGMGVVYKAHDIKLDRDVALKFLPPQVSASEADRQRFIQEAKAAAALNHPNICTIHGIEDVDEGGGIKTFIVMEFVEGKTLREHAGALSSKEAIDIGAQIAGGLAAAHEHGIVHRDIKPENVMVRKDGRVLIMDFGLAMLKGALRLTKTGSTVGTARYMSPEQILGREIDHRSDIFSLGVVLYELFAGRSPFQGEHEAAVLYEIANVEPVPPSAVKPEIRPELDALILDCLAKDPNERCQSAAELRRKLISLNSGARPAVSSMGRPGGTPSGAQGIVLDETRVKRSRRWNLLLSSAVILLLFAVAVLLFYPRQESLDPSKYKYAPFATEREPEEQPAWSPDGKTIAYTRLVEGVSQIFMRNLDNPLPSKLTALPRGAGSPFWSSDGNVVYFISEDQLCSIGLAGGEPRTVLEGGVSAATISPDAKTIAYWSYETLEGGDSTEVRSALYIASPTDTSRRKYRPAPFEIAGNYVPNYLRFSPDGKKLGLSTCQAGAKGGWFWILPWPDGENAKPSRAFEAAQFNGPHSFSWMPDSRHVVLSIEGNLSIGDTETGRLRQITSSVEGEIGNGNVSLDGKRIAFTKRQRDYNVMQIPLDGSQPKLIMASSRNESSLSFAKAGDKAAYITDRSGDDEIWLRVNGVDFRPIVTKKDFPGVERFKIIASNISPDGNHIEFSIFGTNIGEKIFIISTEGGKPTRVLSGDNYECMGIWSPDSRELAVAITENGSQKLAIVRSGGREPPRFIPNTNDGFSRVTWSPDGTWIAYGSGEDIVLVSPDGSVKKKIPSPETAHENGYLLVWSKDGSTIYVASSVGKGARLHAVDINSGKSRMLAEYQDEIEFSAYFNYALFGCLTSDGKNFVTTVLEVKSDIWMLEGFPEK